MTLGEILGMDKPDREKIIEFGESACPNATDKDIADWAETVIQFMEGKRDSFGSLEKRPHLIDATTHEDMMKGQWRYLLGLGITVDDLTEDERRRYEQSERWRAEGDLL